MKLKDILAKKVADLTAEEKDFLRENAESLSDEQKAAFAEALEEKGIDVEEVKKLVSSRIDEVLMKKIDGIADEIVSKFKTGAEAMRAKAIETKTAPVVGHNATREFFKALMSGDRARAKALTTSDSGSDPDDAQAGLLIPEELRAEVLRIKETQYGLARREMFYLPFSGPGNTRVIPSLGTSVSVFWTLEGGKKKSTQPKFNVVTQTLKKLAAIVPMTEEILEDSAVDLKSLLGQLFAEATAKEEDVQFFAGIGSPWTGVLNNGDVEFVELDVPAADMDADALLDLQDKCPTGSQDGAKYYFHRTVLSVIRKLKGTDGQYIYQAPGAGLPGTIWNKPYETSDAFPALADIEDGDAFVLYGNLKQTCIFGDKQQLRVKLLEEATITDTDDQTLINLAEQDMVALRIVERVGYTCALPKGLVVLKAGEES